MWGVVLVACGGCCCMEQLPFADVRLCLLVILRRVKLGLLLFGQYVIATFVFHASLWALGVLW